MKPLWASSYSQPNKTNAIIRPPANANNFQYACGSTSPRLQITSISPVSAAQTQQITIGGYGFGTHQPFSGDSRVFQFSDITSGWNAGNDRWCCGGDWITVNVTKWTDHEIDMSGFGGSYGGGWSLHPGDLIRVEAWNAQTGTTHQAPCATAFTKVVSSGTLTNSSNNSTIPNSSNASNSSDAVIITISLPPYQAPNITYMLFDSNAIQSFQNVMNTSLTSEHLIDSSDNNQTFPYYTYMVEKSGCPDCGTESLELINLILGLPDQLPGTIADAYELGTFGLSLDFAEQQLKETLLPNPATIVSQAAQSVIVEYQSAIYNIVTSENTVFVPPSDYYSNGLYNGLTSQIFNRYSGSGDLFQPVYAITNQQSCGILSSCSLVFQITIYGVIFNQNLNLYSQAISQALSSSSVYAGFATVQGNSIQPAQILLYQWENYGGLTISAKVVNGSGKLISTIPIRP
ncbi:MAG: hypothetical protein M1169_02650 [Firmicutes bacterium]|nr:hypothetical protein [Bacillota bacterium]